MKRKQATHTIEFLVRYYFYLVLSFMMYYMVMFKCLEGKSYRESLHFLLFLVAAGLLVFIVQGVFIKDISSWRIAGAISVPMLVYTTYIYKELLTGKLVTFGVLAGLVTVILFLMYLLYNKEKLTAEKVMKGFFKIASIMLAVSSTLLLFYIAGNTRTSGYIVRPKIEAKVPEENYFGTYQEDLANLSEEKWIRLTYQEKINVLQAAANCETAYLGIDHELNVAGSIMSNATYAFYREKNRSIEVNMNYLEGKNELTALTAKEALICVLHEAYHAYQYQVVELYETMQEKEKSLYLFRDAAVWLEEQKYYTTGYEDYEYYFSQSVEATARDYAEKRVVDYELYAAIMR